MKKLTSILFLLSLSFVTARANAQNNKILVADASSTGMYAKMVGELKNFCNGDDLSIEEVKVVGGAAENLDALVNNRASVAFLHSDVIFALAQSDPKYRNLKTLIALYPEEIHIVALRNSGVKAGGFHGIGGKEVIFNDVAGLRGYKVGAAGGGVYTSRILTGQGEAHFDVVPFTTGKELFPALDSGQVQAIVFVGGAPLANIEALDGNKYKLLGIPESMISKLATVYHVATLTYPNMKSGPIRTLAPDAIALTRKYSRPIMIAPQQHLRECFYEHLDDLKEVPGMHPKWQTIDPNNHGTWDWYELPTTQAVGTLPAIVKKKK